MLRLTRSVPFCEGATEVREQMNDITAFVDASNVYGSDHVTAQGSNSIERLGLRYIDNLKDFGCTQTAVNLSSWEKEKMIVTRLFHTSRKIEMASQPASLSTKLFPRI